MKKLFILLATGLITATSLCFVCCNNTDLSDGSGSLQTEADHFVASKEYQKFASEISTFASKIYQKISTLSTEESEKVMKLCSEIQKCENKNQIITLAQELQDIMGIDYIGYSEKIQKLSEGLWQNTNFTSEEFAKAIRKRHFFQRIAPLSKSGTETPPISSLPDSVVVDTTTTSETSSSDALLEACIQGCVFSSEEAIKECDNRHEHTKAEEKIMCNMHINAVLMKCIEDCKKMYSNSTSEPSGPSELSPSPTN